MSGSTLVLTPPADFIGSIRVKVTVSDGHSSDSESFLVTVEADTEINDLAFADLDLSGVQDQVPQRRKRDISSQDPHPCHIPEITGESDRLARTGRRRVYKR